MGGGDWRTGEIYKACVPAPNSVGAAALKELLPAPRPLLNSYSSLSTFLAVSKKYATFSSGTVGSTP